MDLLAAVRHPLFQSLVLPLTLSLIGVAALRALVGPARAVWALGPSFLLSVVWLTGWPAYPPTASVLQRLPWLFALGWLAGLALASPAPARLRQGAGLSATWLVAAWWLASADPGEALFFFLAGVFVIAGMLRASEDRAEAATLIVVTGLGLAGLAFAAGSLKLFQLAVMLAAAAGGIALWQWPRPRIRFGIAGVGVAAISWLALAQSALLLTPAKPLPVAVLCLAFLTPFLSAPILRRVPAGRRSLAAPPLVAVLSAVFVAIALLLPGQSGNDNAGGKAKDAANDPYYVR